MKAQPEHPCVMGEDLRAGKVGVNSRLSGKIRVSPVK